jgi:hypothetical protein
MSEDGKPSTGSKVLTGCGGCGCLFALVALLGGVVLMYFGLQPRTDEALPAAFGALGSGVLSGLVAVILLGVGVMMMKKSKQQ